MRAISHQEYEGTSRGAPSIDRNVRSTFSSRKKVRQKPRCERRRKTSVEGLGKVRAMLGNLLHLCASLLGQRMTKKLWMRNLNSAGEMGKNGKAKGTQTTVVHLKET